MDPSYPSADDGDTVIYVYLPEEAVDVWRPVLARREDNGYRLPAAAPQDEVWSPAPASVVNCTTDPEGRLVAVRQR